ncbi:PadR family transcriptional regulator [Thermocoleostomius sinensis]|uniref:PadR family transcriptional regulator n=1 Tax=Thermocoleostomius sinensis A174 TaxID=2016057 RepID=A0A9E8ZAG9_9CYAN|nr:PadR family transcriptional regulator [Thermocoleostomius sinensis]WAL59227.1 PadR family transcriptional regulator [Thermocoleostomius sinensis A174]
MSLAHVILGLLQQQQRTGYDLKTECFNQTIAHLWPADQAQIYRTLDKLESQEWITCQVEIQIDRPNRKVYSLTAAGEAELQRWLQTPQPLTPGRDPQLIQLYFAGQLPEATIAKILQQQLSAHRQKLAECEAIASRSEVPRLVTDAQLCARQHSIQQLVLDWLVQRERAQIFWLETLLDRFNQSSSGS